MNTLKIVLICWLSFDIMVYLFMWFDHANYKFNLKKRFKLQLRQIILSFLSDEE